MRFLGGTVGTNAAWFELDVPVAVLGDIEWYTTEALCESTNTCPPVPLATPLNIPPPSYCVLDGIEFECADSVFGYCNVPNPLSCPDP